MNTILKGTRHKIRHNRGTLNRLFPDETQRKTTRRISFRVNNKLIVTAARMSQRVILRQTRRPTFKLTQRNNGHLTVNNLRHLTLLENNKRKRVDIGGKRGSSLVQFASDLTSTTTIRRNVQA